MRRIPPLISIVVVWFYATLALANPPSAEVSREGARPFTVFAVLWRGETAVERGFKAYFAERGIPIEMIIRNLDGGRTKASTVIDEIRSRQPDLVYTWGTTATLGILGPLQTNTPEKFIRDIPAVFTLVAYPVEAGIVLSMAETGRTATGTAFLAPLDAQLRAMKAYRPITRFAVIYDETTANARLNVRQLQQAAPELGLEVISLPIPIGQNGRPRAEQIPEMIAEAKNIGAEFLYMGPDSFLAVHADTYTAKAIEQKLPVFASTQQPLSLSRAMMGLVSDYYILGKLTAKQAESILVAGKRPQDLPVARLSRFSLILNVGVALASDAIPPMNVLRIAEIVD